MRTQSFARTDWINGNSFPSGDSGTYPLESSWTHPLDAPQPSNLHPKPMIAVADLAVGKNLTGQGILEGVVENIAGAGMVPVVDQSSGGVRVFGTDDHGTTTNDDGGGPPKQVAGGGQAGGPNVIAVPVPDQEKYSQLDPYIQQTLIKPWNESQGLGKQYWKEEPLSPAFAYWTATTVENIAAGAREGREKVGQAALDVGRNIVGTAVHTYEKGFFNTMLDGLGHIGNGAKIAWQTRGGAFVTLGEAVWESFKRDPSKFFADLGVNMLFGVYSPNLIGHAAKVIAKPIEALAKKAPGLVQQGLKTLAKLARPQARIPKEVAGKTVAPKTPGGQWQAVNEAMSARARAYQQQVTGRVGESYVVNGVKFDGVNAGGLIDAKGPGYATFVRNGQFQPFFRGRAALLEQAERQIRAAQGTPITWHVAEQQAADAIRALLRQENITQITVVHTPAVQ